MDSENRGTKNAIKHNYNEKIVLLDLNVTVKSNLYLWPTWHMITETHGTEYIGKDYIVSVSWTMIYDKKL